MKSKLSNAEQVRLRTHGKKYTDIHIGKMRAKMAAKGMTFNQAHKAVMLLKIKHLK